jgi:hypothetical protein
VDGRGSTARVLGRLARHAALSLAVVAATVATPGVAAAADGDVLPVLSCVTPDGRGGFTAWLGFRNTGTNTEHIDLGSRNRISPSRYDGDQPTKFKSGSQSRVFSLAVTSGSVSWTLDGTTLWISATSSPTCSSQTPAPEPSSGQVTPLVDCIERQSSWTYTAVLGYSSTHKSTVSIPLGSDNSVLLSQDDPPTVFSPGVHHGVTSLSMTALGAVWTLDGTSLYIAPGRAPECSDVTTMPAEGNDTGAAFALAGAAAVGALLVRRARRRLGGGKTTSDPEDGNA